MFIKKSEYEALEQSLEEQRKLKFESMRQLLIERDVNEKLTKQLEEYKSKETNSKPPLGLFPKYLWDESRLKQIDEAIERRINKVVEIPIEWLEERNDLIEKIYKKNRRRL